MEFSKNLNLGKKTVELGAQNIFKYYNFIKPEIDIDLEVEKIMKNYLLEFSDYNFFGEETGFLNNNSNFTWYLDPIACSRNFQYNIPHFAICLSLFFNEECILGIVLDPVTKELFWAEKNKGAFLNDVQIFASKDSSLDEGFFCCSQMHDLDKLELINKNTGLWHKLPGSWGLSFAWTAANKFKFSFGKLKDIEGTAPGIFIAKEAGCYIKDLNGDDWTINSKDIIICQNKIIYDKVINLMQ